MKKHIYALGTFAFALSMSGIPAIAFAESNGAEGTMDTRVNATTQTRGADASVDASANVGVGTQSSSGRQNQESRGTEDDGEDEDEAVTSNDRDDDDTDESEDDDDEIELELEDDVDVAFSLDDLKKKIENRRHELEDEEASTTPKFKKAVKNANEVRLAVHGLLASRDLLGGIGQQVSEIAKSMNDSVATTTNAEAKIQSRGFFIRLLFGGDSAAADAISQAVERNQEHIDDLMELLGEANVSVDMQAVLTAQIAALQEAQVRLRNLAQKERKMWGLFSWRL